MQKGLGICSSPLLLIALVFIHFGAVIESAADESSTQTGKLHFEPENVDKIAEAILDQNALFVLASRRFGATRLKSGKLLFDNHFYRKYVQRHLINVFDVDMPVRGEFDNRLVLASTAEMGRHWQGYELLDPPRGSRWLLVLSSPFDAKTLNDNNLLRAFRDEYDTDYSVLNETTLFTDWSWPYYQHVCIEWPDENIDRFKSAKYGGGLADQQFADEIALIVSVIDDPEQDFQQKYPELLELVTHPYAAAVLMRVNELRIERKSQDLSGREKSDEESGDEK